MKILIIPTWYPSKEQPYSGIFIKEQVHALKELGVDVVVLYPEIKSLRLFKGFYRKKIKLEDGILTYRSKSYNYLPKIKHSLKLMYLRKLESLINKHINNFGKPDVIHAHSIIWGGWAASQISQKYGIPLVVTEHSSIFGRGKVKKYQVQDIKNTFKQAEKVIAVSPTLKNELEKYTTKDNITVIPNIVDTTLFKYKEKDSNSKNNKFRFFSLARLTKDKGMDILLKAFYKSFKENNNVELIIGGDGEEKENLQAIVNDMGISHRVHFTGDLTRYEVINQMQNCDCFILASKYETFGVVFIEALACGKPIIATQCGGPEMIVNEKNGLISCVDDIDNLSRNMKYLYKNIHKYNADWIINDCNERFSSSSVGNKIIDLYERI